jgi:hypothetical protein
LSRDLLCLVGGGLDSLLAHEVVVRSGAPVRAVHFDTGFVHPARVERVSRMGDVETVDVARDYLREVVVHPKYGHGAAMNPCLDCRAFLLRRAAALADERGAHWLVTGEVVGQRGFDQSRRAFELTERHAGVEGRVLRPLCEGLLGRPAGAPRLAQPALRLHGRTRAGQLALARELGLDGTPTPSGGCCKLADPSFARRLRDLLEHRDAESIGRDEVARLDVGRHFRLAWDVKVVVGRDEAECRWLAARAGADFVARAVEGRGALALVEGRPHAAGVASLVARYAGPRDGTETEIELTRIGERIVLHGLPADDAALARWRI